MTGERNGAPEYPAPLTVESVKDGLKAHGTTSATGGFWITAAELAKVEFPPLQWAVPGLLPEGTVLLSGPPKIGKSAFAVNLCVAVATGGRAFGAFDVEQGDALYLPLEDNGFRRARTRIAKHMNGEPESERLHLNVDMHRLDEDGVYDLEVMLDALPDTRVVVIDTLQPIRPTATSKRFSLHYE